MNLIGQRLLPEGEQLLEFLGGQLGEPILSGSDDGASNGSFGLDELVDLFLERSDANKLVDLNALFLADPKRTIGGLVFDRGVPPPVEVKDVIGGGQVKACTASFEREDEESRSSALARLKSLYHLVAQVLRHSTMKPQNLKTEGFFKVSAEHGAHLGELGEDQDAFTGLIHFFDHFREPRQFARSSRDG
jgi:hypothetical protein